VTSILAQTHPNLERV